MLIKSRTNVHNLNYHLIWVTKYRKQVFVTPKMRHDMKHIIIKIAQLHKMIIQKIEVLSEHIHILISFAPDYSISSVMKSFKGVSARRWFLKYPKTKQKLYKGHLWSPTFYAGTVGDMSRKTVEKYIKNQLQNYHR